MGKGDTRTQIDGLGVDPLCAVQRGGEHPGGTVPRYGDELSRGVVCRLLQSVDGDPPRARIGATV